MPSKTRTLILAFTLIPVVIGLFAANGARAQSDEALENMIKARQGYYQNVRHNAGILFGMAKGDIEYNAEAAQVAGDNLLLLSKLNVSSYWLPGSSKQEMPGKTRALMKIWDANSDIGAKAQAWKKAVADMAAVAGSGVDAVRANAGALGNGCKGCHDNFRAEKF